MNDKRFPSIAEIRAAHAARADYERYLLANTYLFRPLSYGLTWAAARLGFSSEAVSWLSGAAALSGFACLLWPGEPLLWSGAALLACFNLCDCVDGDLARVLNTRNPYGCFLDYAMGWADMLFWGVVGVTVWRLPELRLTGDALGIPAWLWLAAGALASFLSVYGAYLDVIFEKALGKHWRALQLAGGVAPAPTPIAGKPLYEAAARVLVHNLRVRETHYLLLLPAFALGLADALLVFFLAFYALLAPALLFAYCRRGLAVKAAGLGGEKQ